MVTRIKSEKISEAVCNLCKQANIFIPKDVYKALWASYIKEKSAKAKRCLFEILENMRLAANVSRPICQDTGIVIVFAEVGQNVLIDGNILEESINNGVKKAYEDCLFRKSIVEDPIFERVNTNTNTPAIVYTNIVQGDSIKLHVSIKGCGSENMSALKMLKPSSDTQDIIDFVVETVKNAGSNSCPPVRLGIGIGGTMEYSALLSKKALTRPLHTEEELESLAQNDPSAKLELDILREVNKLDIGINGLKGNITAFGVNILRFPTHIAALPVAVNINCHASRSAHCEIVDNNIIYHQDYQQDFQSLVNPEIQAKKVNIEDIGTLRNLKAGETVLLNGYIYTARDAAHKRMIESINTGKELPIDIKDKIIYYTGPCPARENEVIGPAGPTTSCRMDKYTPVLMDKGLFGSMGKGARSQEVIDSIKKNRGIYLISTGGAAVFLAQKIVESKIVAYPDLGPEAVYKLKVKDFPAIVAIDKEGNNILK